MSILPNIPTEPVNRIWWTPARIAQGQAWLQRPENGWTYIGGVWRPPQSGGWLPSTGQYGNGTLEHACVYVLTGIQSYGDYALNNPNITDNTDKYADYGLLQFFIPGKDSPPPPTLTANTTGGALAAGTYYIVTTYYDLGTGNETAITAPVAVTTTGSTGSITVTSPPSGTYSKYRVYESTDSNGNNPPWVLQATTNVGTNTTVGNPLITSGPGPTGLGNEMNSTGPDRYAVHKWYAALYCWLYHHPSFTSTLKSQVRSNYICYVQNYWSSSAAQYLWGSYAGNYCHALMACHLLAAIAFYWEDSTDCETLLSQFFADTDPNGPYGPWIEWDWISYGYQGQGYGAPPIEGPQYGVTLAGYLHMALQAASDAGRDVFNELPFFKQLPFATAHILPNMVTRKRGTTTYDRFAWTWCDNSLQGQGTYIAPSNLTADGLYRTIDHWGTSLAAKVARLLLTRDGYFPTEVWSAMTDGGAGTGLTDLSGLPLDYSTGGGAWMFARSSWGNPSLAISLQFQSPGYSGHNHGDVGNIQLWYGGTYSGTTAGEYLLRETAGYSNNFGPWTSNDAHCHNVPLINGLGEPISSGGQPVPNAQATLLRLRSESHFFFAAVDLTQILHSSSSLYDNGEVQKAVREVMLFRPTDNGPVVLIFDRLTSMTATKPKSVIWHFPFDPGSQLADGHTLESVGQLHKLSFRTWTPHNTPVRTDENTDPTHYDDPSMPQYAFEIQDSSGNNPANILTTLFPRARGSATSDPTTAVSDDGTNLTVTVGTHSIVIPKGSDTANWKIDGVAVSSTLMTCTVDETGVVWA